MSVRLTLPVSLLRVAPLALVVAACFSPNPPRGAPCENDNQCPSSQSCISGFCGGADIPGGPDSSGGGGDSGPTIDGPPDDVDNDTIKNTVDNCPMASNTDQHDEDGDMRGDVCDNCPHLANATQTNGDNDGVGDACDPRPQQAGDTIQVFLPFHVVPQGVSTPLGNWTIQNDSYRNASNFNDAELIVANNRDKVVVEVSGTIEAVQGDTWLAIATGETASPTQFYDCGYMDFVAAGGNPADYHNGVIEYFDGNGFVLKAGNHNLGQRANGAFTIRTSADSTINQVRCTTIDSRMTANTMDGDANDLDPGLVGVKAYGATFRLNYLIVFGQQ